MGYQTEAQLEQKLIEQLGTLEYDYVRIPSEAALEANLKEQMNIHNKKSLKGHPLSDAEFERFLLEIKGHSVFESANILRDKVVIERDDGTELYIQPFDTVDWQNNVYQVTNQTTVEGKYEGRFDVTILINGFPIVQIELKRRGIDFKEAFNQIQRYRRQSYQGLYRFLQLYVISNRTDTKYFANADGEILFGHTFFWSDFDNNLITNVHEFTDSFLERSHLSKMITRYMILNETKKILMVMRPYQVYAVEALVERALHTRSNGYVWHTTGSGKTLTSFKASQLLADEPSIHNVFFLIDRKDLDSQTIEEFNEFQKDSVDTTTDTKTLVNQLKDPTKNIIVTTIQKMANAIRNPRYEHVMAPYRDKRVIFVIDECHRSQFGRMRTMIDKHFNEAQYFGFTGTPRFLENKSQDGRTTADLFEKCLHTYLIKDAIRDGNVLGFSVEYIKTISGAFDEHDDEQVEDIDKDEVFESEERMRLIVENILQTHKRRSRQKKYTALFTVSSTKMAKRYYDLFKAYDHDFIISTIYTYTPNEALEEDDVYSREQLEEVIQDYNKQFNKNFSTATFPQFFIDVSKKVKSAQIDILIVVDMFLTGFDSQTLNTLYVDRFFKHHTLLQAYSRTNRIEGSAKTYGIIVNYRNNKAATDEAIKLFSQTDTVDTVLMQSYETYITQFIQLLEKLRIEAATPEDVSEREDEQHVFVKLFRELSRLLIKLETFTEFEFDESILGIDRNTFEDYRGKYLRIADQVREPKEKVSILNDIDFELELMYTDRVNVTYIMNLIKDIDFTDEADIESKVKFIQEELERTDSPDLRLKIDLIKGFLEKVVPHLSNEDSIDDAYNQYKVESREAEIVDFSYTVGIEVDQIKEHIQEYEFSNMINQTEISDSLDVGLLQKHVMTEQVVSFIKENTARYM